MKPILPFTNEKVLLERIAKSNQQAFCELFNQYHQQLANHIFRLTESVELAEEIVQDVFLKIWINREVLKEVQNFRAYLYVVSKNHALTCLKKHVNERNLRQKWLEESLKTEINDYSFNAYYSLLDEAIDHLPPQQKKVYLLSRHERLKYSEIAIQMDLSKETVKKYLQLAVASITEYVQNNMRLVLLMSIAIKFYFFL